MIRKPKRASLSRCIVCLAAWFCIIHIAAGIVSPSLNRIPYPQPVDLVILALIPVSAFHAAKFARAGIVFTIYGCLASSVFCLYYPFAGRLRLEMAFRGDSVYWSRLIMPCVVTVLLAAACRFAASLRCRWDTRLRHPPGHCQECGYDLTGNESGVCPECGKAIYTSR